METIINTTDNSAQEQSSRKSLDKGFKQKATLPSSMSMFGGCSPKASATYSSYETINLGNEKFTQSQEDLVKPEPISKEKEEQASKPRPTYLRRMGIAVIVFAALLILCQIAVIACISYSLYGYSQFRMYRNGGIYTVMLVTLPIFLVISVLFVGTGVLGMVSVWGSKRVQTITGIMYIVCVTILMVCEEALIIVLISYNIAEMIAVFVPLLCLSTVGYSIVILLSAIRLYLLTRKETVVKKGEHV
ncbi:4 TM domain-containing transmembrane protein [Acrasis kona]|uniref:4 TM domain-containing transmembrane protein n=1 Tax=Acrasis kona TaxID=1008807 RepID=A0AAW2YUK6_9EUKA